MRLLAAIIMLAFLAAAAYFIHAPEKQNAGLPVVHAALKDFPRDHFLFSPCPGGQFAPRPKRNVA